VNFFCPAIAGIERRIGIYIRESETILNLNYLLLSMSCLIQGSRLEERADKQMVTSSKDLESSEGEGRGV
jgi:hypothetical protein